MFNYAAFCKSLSTLHINCYINNHIFLLRQRDKLSTATDLVVLIEQEIYKLFINQIPCLKSLDISGHLYININTLTVHPRAKNCLENLSELYYNSDVRFDDFIYQLSQICQNLLSLSITFQKNGTLDGLTELISVQKNLKYLKITTHCNLDLEKIILQI